eukprot:TRINITY_DN9008_c0_g1_i1.p1 TRINITY_DN9008_c0_g1~~TRINITY_DN9008_c0_g1_i1.p1  ORF type:complete len:205 (+),score=38.61 TRINITY_DN9008_c0_g1_i1:50-664(+)
MSYENNFEFSDDDFENKLQTDNGFDNVLLREYESIKEILLKKDCRISFIILVVLLFLELPLLGYKIYFGIIFSDYIFIGTALYCVYVIIMNVLGMVGILKLKSLFMIIYNVMRIFQIVILGILYLLIFGLVSLYFFVSFAGSFDGNPSQAVIDRASKAFFTYLSFFIIFVIYLALSITDIVFFFKCIKYSKKTELNVEEFDMTI